MENYTEIHININIHTHTHVHKLGWTHTHTILARMHAHVRACACASAFFALVRALSPTQQWNGALVLFPERLEARFDFHACVVYPVGFTKAAHAHIHTHRHACTRADTQA